MKATTVTQVDGDQVVTLADLPEPQPQPNDLLVQVKATALNRADLLTLSGALKLDGNSYSASGARTNPARTGLEFAGEVVGVGGSVTLFKAGDRVMGMCSGGHAEVVAVDEAICMPLPDALSFEEGAAIPVTYVTVHNALTAYAGFARNEALLVHAIGSGVGTAAIAIGRALGASKIIGSSRESGKLRKALDLGLDAAIHTPNDDIAEVVGKTMGDRGVDVVLDVVGAPFLRANMEVLAPDGRLVSVGRLGGALGELDFEVLTRKRLRLIGFTFRGRTFADRAVAVSALHKDLGPLIERGQARPVIDRVFPLAQVGDALAYLQSDKPFGKVVLAVG